MKFAKVLKLKVDSFLEFKIVYNTFEIIVNVIFHRMKYPPWYGLLWL